MKYLVAIDGSEESNRAVEHAATDAAAHGGSLVVLHVRSESPGEASTTDLNRGEDLLDRARKLATDRLTDHDADVPVTTEIRTGRPSSAIVEYAEGIDADGIYLGHRVRPKQREEAVGSVAKSILDTATVPVTIVP